MNDKQTEAIQVLREKYPRVTNPQSEGRDAFLNDYVFTVACELEDHKKEIFYVVLVGKYKEVAQNERELIQKLDAAARMKIEDKPWWNQILNLLNLSGFIALILVCTITYLLLEPNSNREIPEFLKTAFLTIIGFYFGGIALKSKK